MRILVTGSEGHIGRAQVAMLREAGHEVRAFDHVPRSAEGDWEYMNGDLRDITQVRRATQGMDAVIHLAAIPHDRAGHGPDIMHVNVLGTCNVLFACMDANISRVVAYSSVNALGAVGGFRPAAYLPIDDDYPRLPLSPYQLSKHLGEEACRSFSERYGMVTVCLRPVYVMSPQHYERLRSRKDPDPDRERSEFYAYVDLQDVCEAALLGLTADGITHDAFLLTADDTTINIPTRELVDRSYPDTPWKQDLDAYLEGRPFRSFMDCAHAKQILGWQPRFSWRDDVENE